MTEIKNPTSEDSRVLCDIYKGDKKEEMYLFVNQTNGLETVPEALLSSFGELAPVTTLV
ncbi:MAG: YcgL domain-containing protein, partial [Porticoccaceae bacterium]